MVTEEAVVIDKNVDGELLKIVQDAETDVSPSSEPTAGRVLVFQAVLTKQQPHFSSLVEDMPKQSILRRLLRLLFPLVDESQRVRS
ncbi:MAG TPA: hypothetical protein VGO73_02065 [Pyrinomonadaceae bacterium]|jgi:hypothetical protein|nr:hypothetical protein [Pyrinomonadaceae bacterium]